MYVFLQFNNLFICIACRDLSHNRLTKVEEHYFAKVNLTTKHEKKVPFL